jgi:hypothetical protein
MTRPLLIHIHVPKTAGTSINALLGGVVKGRHLAWSEPGQRERLEAMAQEERDRIDFLFGHFPYGLHRMFTRPACYIASLREPRERVFSFYRYVLHDETHPIHAHVKLHTFNFSSFLKFALNDPLIRREIDNRQVRMIAGQMGLKASYAEALAAALAHATEPNFYITDSRHLPVLLARLERELHLQFGAIPVLNTSAGGSFAEEMQKLAPDARAALARLVKWDCMLHGALMDAIAGKEDTPQPPAAETVPVRAVVRALYRTLLFRDPDPSGLNSYAARIARGRSLENAIAQLLKSAEFAAKQGEFTQKYLSSPPADSAEPAGERPA